MEKPQKPEKDGFDVEKLAALSQLLKNDNDREKFRQIATELQRRFPDPAAVKALPPGEQDRIYYALEEVNKSLIGDEAEKGFTRKNSGLIDLLLPPLRAFRSVVEIPEHDEDEGAQPKNVKSIQL